MANGNLLSQPLTQTAIGGFQQGGQLAREGVRRNALTEIAGAVNTGDLAAAGTRAAELGDVELVSQIQSLVKSGDKAKIDKLRQGAVNIQTTLAQANQARQQDPQNFPAVARAMTQQFLARNPDTQLTGEQVFATLMDENQSAAAQASTQGLTDILDREESAATRGQKGEEIDIKAGALAETTRSNLSDEAIKRSEFQAKTDEKAAKAATKQEADNIRTKGAIDDLKSTRAIGARLKAHEGLPFAVGLRRAGPTVPGTSRADFEAIIETYKARLGFAELARMRASSPTGGALGQISERELSFLQAAVQSLSMDQSEAQFIENLDLIDASLARLESVQQQSLQGGGVASMSTAELERIRDGG